MQALHLVRMTSTTTGAAAFSPRWLRRTASGGTVEASDGGARVSDIARGSGAKSAG